MNYKWILSFLSCLMTVQTVGAVSPLPTFEKEAITDGLYRRTGEIEGTQTTFKVDIGYRPGNTGTKEAPAFYVNEIHLIGRDLPPETPGLQGLLASYSHRSLPVEELDTLTQALTDYYRGQGYTVPQAVIPPQEVKDGILEVHIYLAYYDTIILSSNTSDAADSLIHRYMDHLQSGQRIQDRQLEKALNTINDLPAVTARATLVPGRYAETTGVATILAAGGMASIRR